MGNIRIVDLLARGGMGAVYVGLDEKLNRRVAVKAIHDRLRIDPESRTDFLREARALSRLQHPNICQIFDLVEEEDGDFLILELIFGRTLSDAMSEGLEAEECRRIAVQMAEALVAAHEKGVVHWDLKPANVMLTEDGRVKVLDFGLARSLDEEQPTRALPGTEGTGPLPEVADTRGAMVVGTLGYMSPEQARGDRATPASDMYSFGLLLQELFTGEPAFDRSLSPGELLRRSAEGTTNPAHGLEPEMTALIERLKSPTPGPRPSAVDTLERLRWIFDRPVRQRRKWLAIGGVVASLTVAVVTSALWVRGEREADRARAARDQADELVAFMLEDLHAGLEPLGRLDLLDQVAQRALGYYESGEGVELDESRIHRHRVALRNVGEVLEFQGRLDDAQSAHRRALELGERLLALSPGDSRWQHEQAMTLAGLGDVLRKQGELDEAMALFERVLEIDGRLAAAEPTDPGWQGGLALAHSRVGEVLAQQGRLEGARDAFEKSLAARERLVLLDSENSVWRFNLSSDYRNLGEVFVQSGDLERAMESYREALRIRRELSEEDPANAWWLSNVAAVLTSMGDVHFFRDELDEARETYSESLAIRRRLVAQDPTNAVWRDYLSGDSGRIGDVLTRQGQLEAARSAYRESLEIRLRLVSQDPTNVQWQNSLAVDYRSLGELWLRQERPKRALESFDKALEIDRTQAEAAPGNAWWRNSVAYDLVVMGKAHHALGDDELARRQWEEAVEQMEPATRDSTNVGFLDTHVKALLLLGRTEEARPLVEKLLANDWQEPEFLRLARSHHLLPPA